MKSILAFLLAAILASGSAVAQDDGRYSSAVPKIQIGPLVSINATKNIADYHVSGPERATTFGSLIGVAADIPIGRNISVMTSIGYYTLGFSDKNTRVDITSGAGVDRDYDFTNQATLTTEGSFNYLAIAPMLRYSNFCVGLSFGIPLTAKITNSIDAFYYAEFPFGTDEKYIFRKDISPPSSERSLLIEGRIAGDWSLVETPSGSLHITVTASYPFNTMTASAKGEDIITDLGNGQTRTTTTRLLPHLDDNFRLPSLQIGVAYLFSI
ncbi:MAG: hypothetical protein IPP94_17575 [Ignavibacteria bacterium]|nr:hypothetical protein [Ignavibacteria bacterium]